MKTNLTWDVCYQLGISLLVRVQHKIARPGSSEVRAYPVPYGGIHAAQILQAVGNNFMGPFSIESSPESANLIVDDIVDSSRTKEYWQKKYPDKVFDALYWKSDDADWIVFPWEQYQREDGPEDAVRRLLEFIGENPDREGLAETPSRVIRSYRELFSGYQQSPAEVLKVFENVPCDEMVVLDGVEIYSTCEHHIMPFVGKCSVAYIPEGDRVIGLSKLARLVEIYSRRLQVQERLTNQITTALMDYLQPKGAACYIEAKHFCVCSRGVGKQNSVMKTSSLRGAFKIPEVRGEFFSMIGG